MSDLVERLRAKNTGTCDEAADRIESDAAKIESLQRENEELKRLSGIALGHLECTTGDHRIDAVRVLREAFGLPVTPLGEAP